LLAVVVLREQELREPPLREQDDLLKLLGVHADDVDDAGADLAFLRRDADEIVALAAEQLDGRGLGNEALATQLRPLIRWRAHNAPGVVADDEVEADAARLTVFRVVAAVPLLALGGARRRAVEREADGVENARLARTGAARNQENAIGRV